MRKKKREEKEKRAYADDTSVLELGGVCDGVHIGDGWEVDEKGGKEERLGTDET